MTGKRRGMVVMVSSGGEGTVWSGSGTKDISGVAHPGHLGSEVSPVLRAGARPKRDALDNLDAGLAESFDLARVVGQQPHDGHFQLAQDSGSDGVRAGVGWQAQFL